MAKGKFEYWLTEDGLLLLTAWARDGLIDEQIAKNCGIRRETLYAWKKRFPDISNALKKGKEVVDIEVENALLKRALGYSYEEVMTETTADGWKKRITTKQMAPDVAAIFIWLKNRTPKWKDKPDNDSTATEIEDLTPLVKLLKGALPGAK